MQANTTDVLGRLAMRGWRRLGVVLSVLWFFGFGWWLRGYDIDEKWQMSGHQQCYRLYVIRQEGLATLQQSTHNLYTGDRLAQYEKEDSDKLAQYERDLKQCQEKAAQKFMETVSPWWGIILVSAFVLGLLWLLAWVVVAVGRWVAAGFRQRA
jgi:hypothetical protein